jgi:hypothetical protein
MIKCKLNDVGYTVPLNKAVCDQSSTAEVMPQRVQKSTKKQVNGEWALHLDSTKWCSEALMTEPSI